jgi:hypothetical protein
VMSISSLIQLSTSLHRGFQTVASSDSIGQLPSGYPTLPIIPEGVSGLLSAKNGRGVG